MASNVILFGWNRPLPGRERISAEHFGEFVAYLTGLREAGEIESFDAVFLDPHGGDLNGFFLVHGDNASLDRLMASDEWVGHMLRAAMHLDRSGAVRGATRELIEARMERWTSLIPE